MVSKKSLFGIRWQLDHESSHAYYRHHMVVDRGQRDGSGDYRPTRLPSQGVHFRTHQRDIHNQQQQQQQQQYVPGRPGGESVIARRPSDFPPHECAELGRGEPGGVPLGPMGRQAWDQIIRPMNSSATRSGIAGACSSPDNPKHNGSRHGAPQKPAAGAPQKPAKAKRRPLLPKCAGNQVELVRVWVMGYLGGGCCCRVHDNQRCRM